jgi:hypothetical protein
MSHFRAAWISGLVVATLCQPLRPRAAALQLPGDVTVSFRLEQERVSLHEPVIVELAVRNGLDEDVKLDLGLNREGNLRFRVIGPQGNPVDVSPRPVEGLNRTGKILVEPRQTYVGHILINRFYTFRTPGTYKLGANLAIQVRTQSGTVVALNNVPQGEITLDIEPLDTQRLNEVCERLEKQALSPNAEVALESALALSYMTDPTAVPYLEELTRRGPFAPVLKSTAMEGLARIAQADGVDAVMAHVRHPDPDLRAYLTAVAQGHTQ